MNYFKRTFFLILSFLLLEAFFFKHLSPFFLIILSVSFSIIGAYFVQKSVFSSFNELKIGLKRIRNSDFMARLDDVKGKDFREIAEEFNNLANELLKYKEKSIKREKELLSLINSIPEGLMLFDENSNVVVANDTLLKMFPYFNNEAPLASLSIPSLNSFVSKAKEEKIPKSEVLVESGKGKGRTFETTYIPLFKENYALSIIDVSVEKNLERIKYDLVANVSHELRTPISAISSMIEVLEGEKEEKIRKDYFERLKNQVERINSLLNDLLSLSRIEEGNYQFKYEEIKIKELFEELQSGLDALIAKMNLEVFLEIPKDLIVKSDYVLLESVLKNIFENAVKYNKENGKVFLRATRNQEKVVFEIEDTGEGIPEEYRERVFERFFRIDDHRSKKSGGTGLGLSIVKHSLKLLKGEINLQSEVGKGTKFIVTLPLE
ncbi:MAG: sensor histidine kinase [Acidobacteriota bacterium]